MVMDDDNDLRTRHKVSIDGIFRNGYTIDKIRKSFVCKFCLILTGLFALWVFFFNREANRLFEFIDDLASTILSTFPSLLGFSLAGYALIIGASDLKLIGRMSEPLKSNKEKLSYFQTTSCVFASSVLIQCFTLILAFCVHLIVKQKLTVDNECVCLILNFFIYITLLFFGLFSMLLLCSTVVNLFTYGQTVHFCVRQDIEMTKNEEDGLWKYIKEAVIGELKKHLNKYE